MVGSPKVIVGGRLAGHLKKANAAQRADAFPDDAEDALVEARRLFVRDIGIRVRTFRQRGGVSQAELAPD